MHKSVTLALIAALLLSGPLHAAIGGELRDPTRPYSAAEQRRETAAPFRVTALFVAADRRVAVVNGKRVVEGDRVGGATVVAIREDRVQLNHRGKEVVVHLLPVVSRK